jgi:hypothetical protein
LPNSDSSISTIFPMPPILYTRVLFSGCKIRRENLWLVVGCKYTNQRFSLLILQPEKRTLLYTS